MHKIMIFSAGLIICGLATLLYMFSELNQFEQDKKDVGRQTSIATVAEAIERNAQIKDINVGLPKQPWFVNYKLLPDFSDTHKTKLLFESLHKAGNIGEHSSFQNTLGQLNSYQIMANMLLRKDEAHYLNTVSITPNMLTQKQLTRCFRLSQLMLRDLKVMSNKCKCTHDQNTVINIAVGRLTYLNRLIFQELSEYKFIGQNDTGLELILDSKQTDALDIELERELDEIETAPM